MTIYYHTKYALTQGIVEVPETVRTEVKPVPDESGRSYLYIWTQGGWGYMQQISPGEWFTSLTEAQKHAEHLRAKKIASVNKQLTKLRTQVIRLVVIG
jgi:hypothetical protein